MPADFIRKIIIDDLKSGKIQQVVTRFPPEPNGYLHIGHAKSICLNFGIAQEFGGRCHLRFDDTDPVKEDVEYVESIIRDVRWLGFDWGNHLHYTSDYFEIIYGYAVELIQKGLAYVCFLSQEDFASKYRGSPPEPGKEPPTRNTPPSENLKLFQQMRDGKFEEGECVLRAKIDMSSPNIHMRDPVIYRIKKAHHHRTGTKWCIYPTYDFSHCISDALEGITHSICTLEFEVHRPLYDWILQNITVPCHPRQIEFSRLALSHTVLSKRKLLNLVRNNIVRGWDDPRMPTIVGLRRRGYTPSSIRTFCSKLGVTKFEGLIDISLLEHCIREELNKIAPRVMVVLHPVRLVIENYPANKVEEMDAINNPEDPSCGTRKVPFSRELYIEKEDFMENPPPNYYRLAPGREVRLRYAYIVKCTHVIKDETTGEIKEIRCTYDPATRGGDAPDKRKIKGTIHWVSIPHAVEVKVREYDRLFNIADPSEVDDNELFEKFLNKNSEIILQAQAEPSLINAKPEERYQFERKGYYFVDPVDSQPAKPVFNRIVPLRDTWAKIEQRVLSQPPGSAQG
jgi:glutaminyl-tRNA synthetase